MTYNELKNQGIEFIGNVYIFYQDINNNTSKPLVIKVESTEENDMEIVTKSPLMDYLIKGITVSEYEPSAIYLYCHN